LASFDSILDKKVRPMISSNVKNISKDKVSTKIVKVNGKKVLVSARVMDDSEKFEFRWNTYTANEIKNRNMEDLESLINDVEEYIPIFEQQSVDKENEYQNSDCEEDSDEAEEYFADIEEYDKSAAEARRLLVFLNKQKKYLLEESEQENSDYSDETSEDNIDSNGGNEGNVGNEGNEGNEGNDDISPIFSYIRDRTRKLLEELENDDLDEDEIEQIHKELRNLVSIQKECIKML
jgi:hypothetical protein